MSTVQLPTIEVYQNLDRSVTIVRNSGTLDWTAWSTVEWRCPSLSITKSSTSALELQVLDADTLLVLLQDTDYAGATPGRFKYQIVVSDGARESALPLGDGNFEVLAALS